jgi:hypothetical protein
MPVPDGVGIIFLNFFLVILEVAKYAVALSPNSLFILYALETVAQYLESSITFTYIIDLGRNINLGVTYIIPVNKFMQTFLAIKVCSIHVSFFILMLMRARVLRLFII